MSALFSPKEDLVFKLLFGDERHLDILTGFLKAALPLPDDEYTEISLVSPVLPTEFPADKLGILDVQARTRSGRLLDIEIQVVNHVALRQRILFYAARMITGQVAEGEPYTKIKPAAIILITDFELIKENRHYHNRYRLYDPETGSEFTGLLTISTLELPKLPGHPDGTPLWDWLEFMKTQDVEELNMLAEKNPDVGKAVTRLKELSADEKARALREAHEKARRDQVWLEAAAREEGWAKGREEGEARVQLSVARKALERNMSVEDIMELTGLSPDRIRTLLH